jgi:hypothetical protein
MLILTRRKGESLKIGDDVTVTILCEKGCQVRGFISACGRRAHPASEGRPRGLGDGA